MEPMAFFLPMIPPTVTQQMHRVTAAGGRPRFYDSDELKAAKGKLIAHLGRHAPVQPIDQGVGLLVKWCFPLAGGHRRDGEYRITKPDTDNLQKMLKDAMTACRYWRDDALVASEHVEKFWAKRPGIFISIWPL